MCGCQEQTLSVVLQPLEMLRTLAIIIVAFSADLSVADDFLMSVAILIVSCLYSTVVSTSPIENLQLNPNCSDFPFFGLLCCICCTCRIEMNLCFIFTLNKIRPRTTRTMNHIDISGDAYLIVVLIFGVMFTMASSGCDTYLQLIFGDSLVPRSSGMRN